jgi:hypothetical protein
MKPILCVDFDGVIHSYKSGWKGARSIPDPPVEGAFTFLEKASSMFDVQIYSSRSRYFGGRWAMKNWFKKWFICLAGDENTCPDYMLNMIAATAFADPWQEEVEWAAKCFLKKLSFPLKKPAAFLTLDDRAITFTGKFPKPDELLTFKPWNKRVYEHKIKVGCSLQNLRENQMGWSDGTCLCFGYAHQQWFPCR